MSDFLSQDDINALLAANEDGGDFSSIDNEEPSGFAAAVIDFNEQAKSGLETLLSKEVTLEVEEIIDYNESSISEVLGSEEVAIVQNSVSGGVDGKLYVVAETSKWAIFADLMVMGDGSAPYEAAETDDAVKEIYNTVAGAYTTFLKEKSGNVVSNDGIEILKDDKIEASFGQKAAKIKVTVESIEPFSMLIFPDIEINSVFDTLYEPPKKNNILDDEGLLSQDEIDSITAATDDISSAPGEEIDMLGDVPANVPRSYSSQAPKINVDMLLDIDLEVSIELGKTEISIKKVLELSPGTLVELDRLAGEPVDLLVNSKVVAKGEVVVVDESFGIRIISLVSPEERIKSLR